MLSVARAEFNNIWLRKRFHRTYFVAEYGQVCRSLTICMHSNYEVISHAFRLPQLVGVAIVYHVITVETVVTSQA